MDENILAKINHRRRQILAHSYLYYRLDENIVSDYQWSLWGKELAELQNQYPEEAAAGIFANQFIDFDGSTGYDLPWLDSWVRAAGDRLLKYHKEKNK